MMKHGLYVLLGFVNIVLGISGLWMNSRGIIGFAVSLFFLMGGLHLAINSMKEILKAP